MMSSNQFLKRSLERLYFIAIANSYTIFYILIYGAKTLLLLEGDKRVRLNSPQS